MNAMMTPLGCSKQGRLDGAATQKRAHGGPEKHEYKMVSHDENQHKQRQVWRQSGAPNRSVVSEEIQFWGEVK